MNRNKVKGTHAPNKYPRTTSSTPSSKGKQRKTDTEELQNEIEKLKERIVIYRNELDPANIRAELDLKDQTMINMLTDENLRLTEELQKYTSSYTGESTPTGKGKQRKRDTEELQNEIEKLKQTIVIYRSKLDPVKIRKELDLTDQSMINILTVENLRLIEELQKYTSRDTIESSSAQKATDTKKQSNVDRGDANKKESQQKQREMEIIRLQKENDKLKEDVLEVNGKVKTFQNEISHANSETEKQLNLKGQQVEQNANNKVNKRSNHDEVLQQKATEIDALREEVKDLSSKLKEFEDIKTQLLNAKKSVEEKDKQIQEMIKEKTNIGTEKNKLEHECESIRELLKISERQLEDMKKKSSNSDESENKNLKTEKHNIDNKCVGANIMNDNPNMTDLSDENRPTKLSEKHCELYHNEWTDAYEEAENEFKTEEKGIAHLYKTLQDVSDFCKKKSVEHEENIRKSIMTLPNLPSARLKSAKIGAINQHQLKEVRKSFAPMLVESVFQNYVHEKKLNFTKKENTGKFIKKCVEICWLMNSQNPPVIFDTSDVNGKSFDVDKFRTYTKTGKLVDYVVWPPMLLHKGGPMLCKGVAQGK